MKKLIYKREEDMVIDSQEKQVKAIDNLIQSSRLVVDMLLGTAAMDSYLWLYYSRQDKLMHGFCLMLRTWINFQRSWKKGELLRMVDEGCFTRIREEELLETIEQKKYPKAMQSSISPTRLNAEKMMLGSEEQRRQYLEEYIQQRYCLWPDAAPVSVVCIGTNGELIASVEQTTKPSSINWKAYE